MCQKWYDAAALTLKLLFFYYYYFFQAENELAESRDPWNRPATETKIFRIPVASLIMYSMQRSKYI